MSENGRVNILLVDDKPDKVLALEVLLEDLGENIVRAYSGRDALRCLLQNEFAVILLDVNMPGMDGITLVRELRSLPAYKFTPMLVLTTESAAETKQRGKQAGATGWIVKPFNPDQLLATIARVL